MSMNYTNAYCAIKRCVSVVSAVDAGFGQESQLVHNCRNIDIILTDCISLSSLYSKFVEKLLIFLGDIITLANLPFKTIFYSFCSLWYLFPRANLYRIGAIRL